MKKNIFLSCMVLTSFMINGCDTNNRGMSAEKMAYKISECKKFGLEAVPMVQPFVSTSVIKDI